MNRIQSFLEVEPDESQLVADELAREIEQTHCIFTPLHYERNYGYPLVVWLHGPDDDERQVTRIMPLVSMRNYVAVGPRGTVPSATVKGGYAWSQNPCQIALAEHRVVSAIAAAHQWLNVEPSRIYLAGFGCGGTMAFRLALARPHAFAGVLSIGGAFPSNLRPLGQYHAARRLKVFVASARDSKDYPQRAVCANLRLFLAAGMAVTLRQYPCGDEVTTNMLSDMDRWIMEQVAVPQGAPQNQASQRSGGR